MEIGVAIAFVAAGFLLIFCEVFVPGGVLGMCGGIAVLIGIVGGFTNGPDWGLGLLVGSALFGSVGFYLWLKYFPRTAMGKKLILDNDAGDWHSFDTMKAELVGKEGVAHCMLRPAGTVIIDGKRVDVVTEGEMIVAKTAVRVVEVEGNRVVVRKVTDGDAASQ